MVQAASVDPTTHTTPNIVFQYGMITIYLLLQYFLNMVLERVQACQADSNSPHIFGNHAFSWHPHVESSALLVVSVYLDVSSERRRSNGQQIGCSGKEERDKDKAGG